MNPLPGWTKDETWISVSTRFQREYKGHTLVVLAWPKRYGGVCEWRVARGAESLAKGTAPTVAKAMVACEEAAFIVTQPIQEDY